MLKTKGRDDRVRPVDGLIVTARHRLSGTGQHQQLFNGMHELIDTAD